MVTEKWKISKWLMIFFKFHYYKYLNKSMGRIKCLKYYIISWYRFDAKRLQ